LGGTGLGGTGTGGTGIGTGTGGTGIGTGTGGTRLGTGTGTGGTGLGTGTGGAVAAGGIVGDPNAWGTYNLTGFAQVSAAGATTGGGVLAETDPDYFKVTNADELAGALKSKTVKIIEIMNDLDLGWNEIPASARTGAIRQDAVPLLHPVLMASGVSIVDIQAHTGLTIFSATGATIRHAHLNIKRCANVIVRNLKFDELWEWDEESKGDYDKQGWDFITVDMATSGLWIDHCEFTKAYDGVIDVKGGSSGVTISWCKFGGDTGAPGSFVRQQIEALEAAGAANPMYSFLRGNGFSVDDIVSIVRSQKKGHLVGALEMDDGNANLTVTLHHNWYQGMQDRMPRLRAGNAHAYNIYVDNSDARVARARRDAVVAAMAPASAAKLQGTAPTYKFTVTLNGAISTEGGAVLLEASHLVDVLSPIRNNQVDAAMPAFTGKIRALDTIYNLDAAIFRGGSEDVGSALRPVPAPALPFSWNGFTDLPYAYVPDDPASVGSRLTASNGAGAGRLKWDKANWLKTIY
jgi:pectate lyase